MSASTSLHSFPTARVYRAKVLQLLLLSIFVLPLAHPGAVQAVTDKASASQDCEINKGACSKKSGDTIVTLDIQPKPVRAMQELSFTVTLKGTGAYDSLKLDLQMLGMNMGPNQVTLVKSGSGSYTGKGVIPKCHSGKKLWSATVAIPGQAATSFRFNVLY